MDIKIAGWVGLGSAVGGIARYVSSELLTKGAFPLGTLFVNVVGSFLLGVLLASEPRTAWIGQAGTAALGVGVLGGFTTMSAFSFETIALGQEGQVGLAAVYLALTGVLCLGGAWLGRAAALHAFGG